MDTTIKIGDRVRSYDFPGNTRCYVEGVVEAIESHEGCDRYKIKVERQVIDGFVTEVTVLEADGSEGRVPYVYPPVNGTPTWMGKICDGVVISPA